MLWRIPARIVTGPVGFLAAGVIDLLAFALSATRRSLTTRRAVRRA